MMSRSTKTPCLLSFFFSLALLSGMTLPATSAVIHCHEAERQALLEFKQRLHDPSNRLSSWVGEDCCAWEGVGCSNITAHVIKLDLRNEHYYFDDDWEKFTLRCDISTNSSLQSLQHLTHLDISGNDFSGHTIPAFLGSFGRLTYLNLSYARFTGKVPDQLGNLSTLHHLDLSHNYYYAGDYFYDAFGYLYLENPSWIARVTSLQLLNMSWVNFRRTSNWFEALNALSHIQDIQLVGCDLILPLSHSPTHLNFTSLRTLNLAENDINGTEPVWVYNMTTLESLNFGWNDIYWSSMHGSISRLTYLRELDLSRNNISKSFLPSLSNLCKLRILILHDSSIEDELSNLEMVFSGCLMYSLEELHLEDNQLHGYFPNWLGNMKNLKYMDLSYNSLQGSIPDSVGSLKSLQHLDLRYNKLIGTVGESIGQLKNLVNLDLSYNSLSLSLIHLANLSSLKHLDVSNNTLLINDTMDWMPPFQLQSLYMDYCKIVPRPHFPKWLQTQSTISYLSLINVGIEGTIPNWLPSSLMYLYLSNNKIGWELTHFFPNLTVLDLSNNLLSGHLPLQMANMMPSLRNLYLSNNQFIGELSQNFTKLQALDLSNNMFSGHLNPTIGNTLLNLEYLDLSMNNFSGSIPHSLCQMNSLVKLQVSKNNFSGELPNCWNSSIRTIILDFSNNQIYGEIPNTLCNLWMLQSLHLSYNHLSGKIPLCLHDCKYLTTIDIRHNHLVGNIPSWSNKSLSYLKVLNLRSNSLSGIIPELSMLTHLQILDLSNNNLLGSIPRTFANFTTMRNSPKNIDTRNFLKIYDIFWIFIKGNEHEYDNIHMLATSIDLSNNDLSGYIPQELGTLNRLQSLNLSRNNLTGEIPRSISGMQNLEVLDLSRNNLLGAIPSTVRDLTFLGILNLSYNNLSGRIPTGRQMQTFDAYAYIGNPYLCGSPLTKNCTSDMAKGSVEEENKDGNRRETIWLLSSIVMGFIMGFWGIWGTLLLHKRWRILYFHTIDDTYDKLCMEILVKIKRKHFVED